MNKRSRRNRKALLAKIQRVILPPCALAEGTSKDYIWDEVPALKPPVPAEQLVHVSSAELFEMIQAAGSLEEPPYAGLIGLLSEQMAGEL